MKNNVLFLFDTIEYVWTRPNILSPEKHETVIQCIFFLYYHTYGTCSFVDMIIYTYKNMVSVFIYCIIIAYLCAFVRTFNIFSGHSLGNQMNWKYFWTSRVAFFLSVLLRILHVFHFMRHIYIFFSFSVTPAFHAKRCKQKCDSWLIYAE